MLVKTHGIVLHTVKYSESSVISKVYTREKGLLTFMVNGVRSTKAKGKSSLFQPLTLLDMVVYFQANKNLLRLKEYQRSYIFKSLPFNIQKSTIALFVGEILNKVFKEGQEADEDLFDFLVTSIDSLDASSALDPDFHLKFLLQLTMYLGFYPENTYNDYNSYFDLMEGRFRHDQPIHGYFLQPELARDFSKLLEGKVSQYFKYEVRKELIEKLILFYALHIENFGEVQSHKILREILS